MLRFFAETWKVENCLASRFNWRYISVTPTFSIHLFYISVKTYLFLLLRRRSRVSSKSLPLCKKYQQIPEWKSKTKCGNQSSTELLNKRGTGGGSLGENGRRRGTGGWLTSGEIEENPFFTEGLPGVLGNKGTKEKYRREHEPVSGNAGTTKCQLMLTVGEDGKKIYQKGIRWGKTVRTSEYRAIFEGKKGTRTLPRPGRRDVLTLLSHLPPLLWKWRTTKYGKYQRSVNVSYRSHFSLVLSQFLHFRLFPNLKWKNARS